MCDNCVLGLTLEGEHGPQVVLMSQFSKVLLNLYASLYASAWSVFQQKKSFYQDSLQFWRWIRDTVILLRRKTWSVFAGLYSAQQTVLCWSFALWSRGKKLNCILLLLPRRAKSLQVGGDPVVGGNTAGWEVREEQLCYVPFFFNSGFWL